MTDCERLAALLPGILAEIDDAGSVADDWIDSRYVDELATRLIAAGVRLDEPAPGLRKAAQAVVLVAKKMTPEMAALNRALAATPAEPPTLDVERLARAMARCAEIGGPANHTPEMAEEHWPSYVMEATEYAREYGGMPVALDVGRLALALDRVPFDSEMTQHDLAAFIAAEYARLASERRSEPRK